MGKILNEIIHLKSSHSYHLSASHADLALKDGISSGDWSSGHSNCGVRVDSDTVSGTFSPI